jgi:hypothetical protein
MTDGPKIGVHKNIKTLGDKHCFEMFAYEIERALILEAADPQSVQDKAWIT